MPAPTLGCQVAPHYNHDHLYTDTESDSESDSSTANDDDIDNVSTRTDSDGFETAGKAEESPAQRGEGSGQPVTGLAPALQRGGSKRNRRESPTEPVGFWHWQMAGVRLHVLKLFFRQNIILAIAIMAFLCMFWGALFRQVENIKALDIYVVDFDGSHAPYDDVDALVGPFLTSTIREMVGGEDSAHPDYQFRNPDQFGGNPLKVRESIYELEAWAAIIINANATSLLEEAVREGNDSYDPAGACQIILNTARDQSTYSSYIIPSITSIQSAVHARFGRRWLSHLRNTSNSNADNSNINWTALPPQAISPGIDFTTVDLRPFGPSVATPAVSIGLIYLVVISFFSYSFFLPIHLKYLSPRGHPPLHFPQLIVWRYTATVLSYFFLSLIYSLVSLVFLVPMTNAPGSHVAPERNPTAHGSATFVVFWMVNWVGMTAFGLASENMAMLLGTPWTALWLIFWIISNVATGFYPLVLAVRFFDWGFAWPMYNVVQLTRSTLFDLHAETGVHWGVLFAWVAVDTLLFPACCYYMRWNTARVKRNAARVEAEWHAKMEKERENPGLLTRMTSRGKRVNSGGSGRGEVGGGNVA